MSTQTVFLTQYEITKKIATSDLFFQLRLKGYDLTMSAKLVLILISNYYPNMFPSIAFIALKLDISPRSVQRAINELSEAGLISYETKRSNHYNFTAFFFELVNLSDKKQQNDTSPMTNCHTNKQVNKINNILSCKDINSIDSQQNNDVNLKNSLKEPSQTAQDDDKSVQSIDNTNKPDDNLEKINALLNQTDPICNNNNNIEHVQADQDVNTDKQDYSPEDKQKYKILITLLLSMAFYRCAQSS